MRNNYALVVSASFLIAALSIAYYYVIFLPKKFNAEQEKITAEQLKAQTEKMEKYNIEAQKQKSIDDCIKTAYDNYIATWNLNCPKLGIDKKTDGCSLPKIYSDSIEKDYNDAKEFCLKRYN